MRALLVACACVGMTALQPAPNRPVPNQTAAELVGRALDSLGGKARLQALKTVRTEGMGHDWHLEQSERPEGPWLTSYIQRTEIRDVAAGRLRRETQTRNWSRPEWAAPAVLVTDGRVVARASGDRFLPAPKRETVELTEALALFPDQLLQLADAASDLKLAAPRTLQGMTHDGVMFRWNDESFTIFLNPYTHRPTMVEVVKPDPGGAWGPPVWGDVTERHWFGWWDLIKGVYFARQVTTEWNGFAKREFSVLKIAVDEPIAAEQLAIPAEAAAAIAQAAAQPRPAGVIDESRIIAVNAAVTLIPSGYNVMVVQQPDGLVVFEATTSSEFTARMLAVIEKRFAGMPIKALVTTSDAWPHIGGVREFVARRIPIYALDLNLPILERLVAAKWSESPDTLARAPQKPIWKTVTARTTIGSGETRIELIPVRGELGERMMIAAMPGLGLAYTSDLIQRSSRGAGFFMPGMLVEVIDAWKREQIAEPERAVGMHLAPVAWTEISNAANAARESKDPS